MKYGAILADPPWAFKTYGNKHTTPHRCAEDHYKTLSFDDLRSLPVADWATKDCALFMWAVDSHLDVAIELGRSWGFSYKTRAFTWRKLTSAGASRIGMGYWTRKQTELCLLFTRGKPKRLSKGVREIIDAQRREHSRKPDEIYTRIEALVSGPYLEMFARQRHVGWDAWGNEADKFDASKIVIWAHSEQEAASLQSQGWICDPKQPITHHHNYSVLLRWPHKSAPPAQVAA